MAFHISLLEPHLVTKSGLSVCNPATGETIAQVRIYAAAEVEEIISAADSAKSEWANLTAKARAVILKNWTDLILENQNQLAELITLESGKPFAESKSEVSYGASFVEWFAEEGKRTYGDVIPRHASGKQPIVIKQPIGVTAAITPWNFPLALITRKAGPALASGCPMIVKPAESTPLTALALETLAHQAGIPKAIFRTLPTNEPATIGKVFCHSSTVRKLSFTGSTAVGKTVLAQCAGTVKRVSMELGGNAPFIVFGDADIDAAVEGAMASKYRNAGQTCVCANRFLIDDSVHDEFVEKLAKRVSALNVGKGSEPGVEIGPLINKAGADKVANLVESAVHAGAVAVIGGNRHSFGDTFFEPTVLTGVTHDMEIASAEIFGPVAPVFRFKEESEAIAMANDTPYGLASYFYSRDIGRIWRVMEALEYGMIGVNEGIISTEVAPFGGIKESGLGREGAHDGIDEFLEVKYALIGGLLT